MNKYKVFWEVKKYAIVEAENENEAVDKVWGDDSNIEQFEDEITTSLEAIKI